MVRGALFFPRHGGELDRLERREEGVGGGFLLAVDVADEVFVFFHEGCTAELEGGREESVVWSPLVGDEAEELDLLVRGEGLVVDVEHFPVFVVDFGHGDELGVVAVVQFVFECPEVEGVEVGGDDGGGAFLVFADDHDLFDVFGAAEHVLDELWRNVFAGGEFEDVFLAVGDFEVAAADEGADVAGVEPAVGLDDLCGVFGVFVVAHHDVGSAGEDFAVVGEFHFDTAEDGSDGADFDHFVSGVVDGDDGGGLAEAVAFVDVDAGGGEDAYHVGLDGAGAGDDGQVVAAEFLAPFAVDEPVKYLLAEDVHG